MLTWAEVREVVQRCNAPGLDYQVITEDGGKNAYLQATFYAPACEGGPPQEWHTRKWRLSPHMTPSEIARTCFLAALTAQEHELRECFTYRGRAVFGPHISVDTLWGAAPQQDRRRDV